MRPRSSPLSPIPASRTQRDQTTALGLGPHSPPFQGRAGGGQLLSQTVLNTLTSQPGQYPWNSLAGTAALGDYGMVATSAPRPLVGSAPRRPGRRCARKSSCRGGSGRCAVRCVVLRDLGQGDWLLAPGCVPAASQGHACAEDSNGRGEGGKWGSVSCPSWKYLGLCSCVLVLSWSLL